MPTNRKRVSRPWQGKNNELTKDQKEHLLYGYTKNPFRDDEERKKAWFDYREELMAVIGSRYSLSWGLRPHAWWSYEAPEPRKMIKPAEPGYCEPDGRLSRGKPKFYKLAKLPVDLKKLPQYESQFEYLKRLGLLFPGEEEKIDESAQKWR